MDLRKKYKQLFEGIVTQPKEDRKDLFFKTEIKKDLFVFIPLISNSYLI